MAASSPSHPELNVRFRVPTAESGPSPFAASSCHSITSPHVRTGREGRSAQEVELRQSALGLGSLLSPVRNDEPTKRFYLSAMGRACSR